MLDIQLFGHPKFILHGEEITSFPTRKISALLAYLAVTGTAHSREHLADLLWPELPEANARRNLRHALTQLRRALGSEWLDTEDGVALNRERLWSVDVQLLHGVVDNLEAPRHGDDPDESGTSLAATIQQVLQLYRGEFLHGFHVAKAAPFEEWLLAQRETAHVLVLQALEALARAALEQGALAQGLTATRRLLQLEPWSETAHILQMKLLARNGQTAAALAQYETCCQILADELGVDPSPQVTQLYQQIQAGDYREMEAPAQSSVSIPVDEPHPTDAQEEGRDGRADEPSDQSVAPKLPPHNLPAQLVPLIGYGEEFAYILRQLSGDACRLLTIVGLGGMGKTHLALAAARRLVEEQDDAAAFADGVYFVPLDGAAETDTAAAAEAAIATAIATATGHTFHGPESPQVQIQTRLRHQKMLLILDNLEHLMAGARFITSLLQQAEGLRILATSRMKLGLQGEHLLTLHGLAVKNLSDTTHQSTADAVELFAYRARLLDRHFRLDAENRDQVARICELVGGLPLGIELAASWLDSLDCRTIARELTSSLDFLVARRRDLPARHHTLRTVFNQSWALLSPLQQTLLARLSLFQPPIRPAAALAVAGASPRDLSALVDRSLLSRNDKGGFAMHPNIRQFARERLARDADECHALEERYVTYYLGSMGWYQGTRNGVTWQEVQTASLQDMDNVKAALYLAVQHGMWASLRRALDTVSNLYDRLGWYLEGQDFCRVVSEQLDAIPAPAVDSEQRPLLLCRGQHLVMQAWFEARTGQMAAAQTTFQRALCTLRQAMAQVHANSAVDEPIRANVAQGLSTCLMAMGLMQIHQGQLAQATPHLEEALTLAKRPSTLAMAWFGLAQIQNRMGRYPRAKEHALQALRLIQEADEQWLISVVRNELARIEQAQGNYQAAEQLLRTHVAIPEHQTIEVGTAQAARDEAGVAQALHDLGEITRLRGAYTSAAVLMRRGLELAEQIGFDLMRRNLLWALGNLHLEQGDYAGAKEYFLTSRRDADLHVVAMGLPTLGWAHMGLTEYREAERYFLGVIRAAQPIQAYRNVAEALGGLIVLLDLAGALADPADSLAQIERHSATAQETKERIRRLHAQFVRSAPADALRRYCPAPDLWETLEDALRWFRHGYYCAVDEQPVDRDRPKNKNGWRSPASPQPAHPLPDHSWG